MTKIEIRNLLTVKSIITIIFSLGYCILAIMGRIKADDFNQIMLIIVTFYFAHKCSVNTNKNESEIKKYE